MEASSSSRILISELSSNAYPFLLVEQYGKGTASLDGIALVAGSVRLHV